MKKINGTMAKMSGYMLVPLINAAISFLSIPIITALFPQETSGQISMFITYQNILLSFALLGMDQTMSRYYYHPPGSLTNRSLTTVCFLISTGSFVLTGMVCFVCREFFSDAIVGQTSLLVIVCLVIDVFAHLVLRFLNQASRLQDNVGLYVIQSICITLSTKLSYIVVAFTTGNVVHAIIVITITSTIFTLIFLCLKAKKIFAIPNKKENLYMKKLVMFGVPQIPVFLLATLNNGVSQIALERFCDYAVVGVYSVAVSVSNAIAIVQSSINVIWAPYVYKNYQTKQNKIIYMHHIVSMLMIVAGLALCLFEDVIYSILVNPGYWGSKIYFPLLLISPICYTISETLGIGFKLAEKPYWNILVYSVAFTSNAILCCVLIPNIGAIGTATAAAVSSIIMLIIKSICGERYYRCSDNYWKLIISFIAMSIAMWTVIFFYDSVIRYVMIITAMVITVVMYMKEIKYVIHLLFRRQ